MGKKRKVVWRAAHYVYSGLRATNWIASKDEILIQNLTSSFIELLWSVSKASSKDGLSTIADLIDWLGFVR